MFRYILHDWSKTKAIEILERLREVAVPGKTKVAVIDGVVQHARAVNKEGVPGAEGIVFAGSDKKSVVFVVVVEVPPFTESPSLL